MSIINSFLQKRKMHENQHGIAMVITAYVLSFIMLVVGSDVFYNINSTAAGLNEEANEEAEGTYSISESSMLAVVPSSVKLQNGLLTPYALEELSQTGLAGAQEKEAAALEPTIWLLGRAVSTTQYDSLMEQAGTITSLSVDAEEYSLVEDDIEDSESVTPALVSDNSTVNDSVESDASDKDTGSSAKESTGAHVMSFSAEEIGMLERIVESEASGEDIVGKILIANVVLNRLIDEEFPDTVEGVIFHRVHGKYQFSPVSSKRYWRVKISEETKEAVQRALEGEDYSEGALYFMARSKSKKSSAKWFDTKLDWLFKHGGHEFYKNK